MHLNKIWNHKSLSESQIAKLYLHQSLFEIHLSSNNIIKPPLLPGKSSFKLGLGKSISIYSTH